MTADDTPPITLPATEMTRLAAPLTELGDQFPLSSSLISEHRAAFFSRHGHVDPGYLADVLVDEVAFVAACRTSLADTPQASQQIPAPVRSLVTVWRPSGSARWRSQRCWLGDHGK